MKKQKQQNKICIRCREDIKEKENYIELKEWDNKKIVKHNFLHKKCWEEMMETKSRVWKMADKAFQLLNKAEGITQ